MKNHISLIYNNIIKYHAYLRKSEILIGGHSSEEIY